MHQFRVNNSTGGGGGMHHHRDIVRSNSEMGPERNLAMLDRGMMGMRDDRSSRDMMAPRDYMRSNSEMMGMRDNRKRFSFIFGSCKGSNLLSIVMYLRLIKPPVS